MFFGFLPAPSQTRLARANQPPVWSPLTDMVVPVGNLLQFLVSAADPEGQPLTYSAYQLPVGADFNSESKIFSWTPLAGQEGKYQLVLRASDGTAAADLKVNIIAGSNPDAVSAGPAAIPPPVIQPQTAQVAEAIGLADILGSNWFLLAIAVLLLIIILLLVIILRRG